MKKAKRIIAALMSALITSSMAVGMNAFANIDIRNSEAIAKLLDGYTQIEEPAAFEKQEYLIEQGASYYVNEAGNMLVIQIMPNSFVVELPLDYPDSNLEEIIDRICPDAEIHKCSASLDKSDTKAFEVIGRINSDITLSQAKNVYNEVGDSVVNFKYCCDRYYLNFPQYYLSNHKYFRELYGNSANGKSDFTLYSGLDNQEKLQSYIDENDIKCHLELHEKLDAVDVVPDTDITYLEEIQLAGQIYKGTGLKPEFWLMAETVTNSGSKIDLYGSVSGDANCDKQMDMSDVVLIMQSLANPDKYKLSAQGCYNADMNGDGITVGDAQAIQNQLLGIN